MKNDYLFFDLGTENIRIFSSANGLIYHGPGLIAINDDAELTAYGSNAVDTQVSKETKVIYPISNGTVANHHALLLLLKAILKDHYKKQFRSRVKGVFSIPPFATNVEQRAYLYAAEGLEFSDLLFIPEYVFILTSIYEAFGKFGFEFIGETGAGRFDTYLLNNGKLLYGDTQKGGFERIINQMLRKLRFDKGIQIGRKTLFMAFSQTEKKELIIKGRNKVTGEALEQIIPRDYFDHLLQDGLSGFIDLIKTVFERLSPDLSAEFLEKGLRMTGGPSNEKWFRNVVEEKTGFSIFKSETPGEDILNGFKIISNYSEGEVLGNFNLLGSVIEVR